MSCTDPILSIEALIQRAALYTSGCGALRYAEQSAEGAFDCDSADIPDLVLLAMAFDSGANTFRVEITNVDIADLCDRHYELRITCEGITASQALRETFTVGDGVATIRVLFVTGTTGACDTDCVQRGLDDLVGATVVTDGVDSYVLAVAPDDTPDELTCETGGIGGETYARASLSSVGGCGMRAWRVTDGALSGGDFNGDFNNDFNI